MSAILAPRALPIDRLPWTRARATRKWMSVFALLAVLRLALLAAIPVFTNVSPGALAQPLAKAVLFPALFLGLVAFCERRLLRRPPKGLLVAQLACFCAGALLQATAFLGAAGLETLANVVLSGSTLLLGSWFLAVLLVPED